MPSPSSHSTGFPLSNGHLSSPVANVTNGDKIPSHSDSELSDAKDATAEDGSSNDEAQEDTHDEDAQGYSMTDSSEDVDAEGEPDGDYDSETPPPAEQEASAAETSSSDTSRRPSKRKASVDDDEFMEQNPELYGLRRSVCYNQVSSICTG